MPANDVELYIDGERAVTAFEEVIAKLDGGGEVVLDLSSVRRVDARALGAMEKLAGAAGEKGVKIVLRGVNAGIYKALKLVKLTPRFGFAS